MSFKQGGFSCDLLCIQCKGRTEAGVQCKRRTCARLPTCFQHTRSVFGVDVRPSAHGMGLFALKEFNRGDHVVPYIGDLITEEERRKRYGTDVAPYGHEIDTGETVDSACARGLGAFANDYRTDLANPRANKAAVNVEIAYEMVGGEYQESWLQATKKIAPGHEILANYGSAYWNMNRPPHQTLKRKLKPYTQRDADAAFKREMDKSGGPSAFKLPRANQLPPTGGSSKKVKLFNVLDVYKNKRDVYSDVVQHIREHPDARYAPAHEAQNLVGVLRPTAVKELS